MRVAIDASGAAREQGSGVAVYIKELVRALASVSRDDEFFLFYRLSRVRDRGLFLEPPGPNFRTVVPPMHLLRARRIDIAHGPDSRLLELGRGTVATVHDVFSLVSDEWADAGFRKKKRGRYARIAKKARLIICDSQSTADDFARLFPGTRDRLRVVPLGVGPEFYPLPEAERSLALARLGIRGPYILHVGNIAGRKNLTRLVEAFAALAGARAGLHLVLAGRLSYGHEEVLGKISASDYRGRIILPGYVPRTALPALYGGARALVLPSLYEGFGLPALEAMACGTPVLSSDRSSLPEVVGDAGILFDPEKTGEIAGAIGRLLADGALCARLSEAGIARARGFTWRRTAEETLKCYQEALL